MMTQNSLKIFSYQIYFEFLYYCRHKTQACLPLIFYILIISLFSIGLEGQGKILQTIAPVIIWISVLMASQFSIESSINHAYQTGDIHNQLLSPYSIRILILAKLTAQWIVTILPMILCTPLLGHALYLEIESLLVLSSSLLIGTPILLLVGSIHAALTVGLLKGGMLLSILNLPLSVPILIFGISSVTAYQNGFNYLGPLAWLMAILITSILLAPWAIQLAIRARVEG